MVSWLLTKILTAVILRARRKPPELDGELFQTSHTPPKDPNFPDHSELMVLMGVCPIRGVHGL